MHNCLHFHSIIIPESYLSKVQTHTFLWSSAKNAICVSVPSAYDVFTKLRIDGKHALHLYLHPHLLHSSAFCIP